MEKLLLSLNIPVNRFQLLFFEKMSSVVPIYQILYIDLSHLRRNNLCFQRIMKWCRSKMVFFSYVSHRIKQKKEEGSDNHWKSFTSIIWEKNLLDFLWKFSFLVTDSLSVKYFYLWSIKKRVDLCWSFSMKENSFRNHFSNVTHDFFQYLFCV